MISYAELATLCHAAYPHRRGEVKIPDCWRVTELEHKDASGIWCYDTHREVDVIAVAGSDEANDWANNRKHSTMRLGGVEVREGFVNHAKMLATALDNAGLFSKWRRWPLYLTGHSLGGAAAAVLPLIESLGFEQIVTFGQPRFATKDTIKHYPHCGKLTRIVRTMDVVPDVPLRFKLPFWPSQQWSHCGNEIWIDETGTNQDPTLPWRVGRRVKRAGRYAANWYRLKRVMSEDHNIAEYARLCRQWGI